MQSLNEVRLIGNVGQDPEMRSTPSGTPVANLSLATNYVYKDAQGERQEATEWHQLVAFGKQAELVGRLLAKGRAAYVFGRLKTSRWEDSDQVRHARTEIVVDRFILLDRRDAGEAPAEADPAGDGFGEEVPEVDRIEEEPEPAPRGRGRKRA